MWKWVYKEFVERPDSSNGDVQKVNVILSQA